MQRTEYFVQFFSSSAVVNGFKEISKVKTLPMQPTRRKKGYSVQVGDHKILSTWILSKNSLTEKKTGRGDFFPHSSCTFKDLRRKLIEGKYSRERIFEQVKTILLPYSGGDGFSISVL